MTTTNVLRKLFKKLFNVDLNGNSSTSVLADALDKEISVGGGGGLEPLVVSPLEDNPWSMNCSFRQVWEAYLEGRPVYYYHLIDNNSEDVFSLSELHYYTDGDGRFSCTASIGFDFYSTDWDEPLTMPD